MRKGGSDPVEHALDIGVDLPLVDLEEIKRRDRHNSSIVHQDVDLAVCVDGLLYQGFDLRPLREIFQRHTDLIEPLTLDEAYLDVSENKTGLPTATRVAKAIRQQTRDELQLTASAGVAPNKFLAKIASDWRKSDGLFVIQPEDVQTFLPPLPVGRIPGVGKVTETRLKQMSILTVGGLQALELAALEARFGRYGMRLYELARGIDDSKVIIRSELR